MPVTLCAFMKPTAETALSEWYLLGFTKQHSTAQEVPLTWGVNKIQFCNILTQNVESKKKKMLQHRYCSYSADRVLQPLCTTHQFQPGHSLSRLRKAYLYLLGRGCFHWTALKQLVFLICPLKIAECWFKILRYRKIRNVYLPFFLPSTVNWVLPSVFLLLFASFFVLWFITFVIRLLDS